MPAKGAEVSAQTSTGTAADVLIVGGGVIGLSIGWRAAEQGMRVGVADPQPGQGATHAAAGMLTPIAEAACAEREICTLGRGSPRPHPASAAELGSPTGRATRSPPP